MVKYLSMLLPKKQTLYHTSPWFLKRLLTNLEARRRDWFRRYGDYDAEKSFYDPSWYKLDLGKQQCYQIERLNYLLQNTGKSIPFYQDLLPDCNIYSLQDMRKLPILEKIHIQQEPLALVQKGLPKSHLWSQLTSGSTGTPLHYYRDREALRSRQAILDILMEQQGCQFGERRARFSGALVVPYRKNKPPFWIYVDHYSQLQCSAYHLSPESYKHYLQAMRAHNVRYGTGYATAWHFLASSLLETGETPPNLKAIFTDSEGLNLEQQYIVEQAFDCPVFQTYGTGEVGTVAIQCSHKRYHLLTKSSFVEILDDQDNPVHPGETGQVIVTDLTGIKTPFIRYRTGDLATLAADACDCGWQSPSLIAIDGRVDDHIITPEGRLIGRLSHVLKPGIGIRESQIVQQAINKVIIRIVPDHNFDSTSMELVTTAALQYMGDSIHISWEVVDKLPRMKSGKLRHVVREF